MNLFEIVYGILIILGIILTIYTVIIIFIDNKKYRTFNKIILSFISIFGLILLGDIWNILINLDIVGIMIIDLIFSSFIGIFIIFNIITLTIKHFGKK